MPRPWCVALTDGHRSVRPRGDDEAVSVRVAVGVDVSVVVAVVVHICGETQIHSCSPVPGKYGGAQPALRHWYEGFALRGTETTDVMPLDGNIN